MTDEQSKPATEWRLSKGGGYVVDRSGVTVGARDILDRIDAEKARADRERDSRIKWQSLVYTAMNVVDAFLGSKTTVDEFETHIEQLVGKWQIRTQRMTALEKRIAELEAELQTLRQADLDHIKAIDEVARREGFHELEQTIVEQDERIGKLRAALRMVEESCSGMVDEHGLAHASFSAEDLKQIMEALGDE